MKGFIGLFAFVATAAPCFAQSNAPVEGAAPLFVETATSERFASNSNFPNFIGFISNPVQNIDPRSVNRLWPIVSSNWASVDRPRVDGDLQVYGAGLNLAITERFSIGFNSGGYATSHFDRRIVSRSRDGWLNIGGFVQYTLIENVPEQFLLTAGLRYDLPTGEAEVFQGHGPVYLAPYLTFGKEFGNFHVLGTVGYDFPAGSDDSPTRVFNSNVHFDYRIAGWFYPLVEVNASWSEREFGGDFLTRRGNFNLGNFSATGNIVSLAVGFNAVLIQDRLEFGAVYTTPIYTQRDFDFDGAILRMTMHF